MKGLLFGVLAKDDYITCMRYAPLIKVSTRTLARALAAGSLKLGRVI